MTAPLKIVKSSPNKRGRTRLSVLIPYYNDDPSSLLQALLAQSETLPGIEILLYDDGTNDKELNCRLCALVKTAGSQVQLIIAQDNLGRAASRNTLQEIAKSEWVLFLDADMLPSTNQFLSDYMKLIEGDAADVIFGGFTVPKTASPDQELHRALSEISDCLTLEARQARGPQYVASSNLCVRKSVLQAEPFDTDFTGWGWEDSEWAARVDKRFSLRHADIPAMHLGLESTETLLRRFQTSGHNYVRFTRKHPEVAQTLKLFSLSQRLSRIPGQKCVRPLLKFIVKFKRGPVRLRLMALKLWRASWYAEAFV